MKSLTKEDIRKRYSVWKTSDVRGSSEPEDNDEWLFLPLVLKLIDKRDKEWLSALALTKKKINDEESNLGSSLHLMLNGFKDDVYSQEESESDIRLQIRLILDECFPIHPASERRGQGQEKGTGEDLNAGATHSQLETPDSSPDARQLYARECRKHMKKSTKKP